MSAILIFLLGLLAGANAVGLLAVILHRRFVASLREGQSQHLKAMRRKAYAQGYETRAALEFAARSEGS